MLSQFEHPAQTDELPLASRFSLNSCSMPADTIAPADRSGFLPALEGFLLCSSRPDRRCARRGRRDPGRSAARDHVFPALQHEFALHQATAELDEFLGR